MLATGLIARRLPGHVEISMQAGTGDQCGSSMVSIAAIGICRARICSGGTDRLAVFRTEPGELRRDDEKAERRRDRCEQCQLDGAVHQRSELRTGIASVDLVRTDDRVG